MGAKSAPPPDPRLTERQIRSMDVQDEAVRAIMANSAEMAPLQREQMRFGLDTQRAAYEQSQQDREWTLRKRNQLDKAQKPFLDEAANFDEAARGEQLRGEAYGDISQSFAGQRGVGARALTRSGVSPTAGRYAAMQSQVGMQEALAKAKAGSMVRQAAKAEGLQLRGNATNMLAGYPAQASALSGQGASYGTGGLNMVNSGLAGMNGGYTAASGNANAMGGNAANMYGIQQQAYTASQNAKSQETGAYVGAATSLAMLAMMSDRRAKFDIKRVGETDYGLPIYTYRYRSEGVNAQQRVGVMADEVKTIRPEAYLPGYANGYDAVDYSKI